MRSLADLTMTTMPPSRVTWQHPYGRAAFVTLLLTLTFVAACGSDGKVGVALPGGSGPPLPTLTPVPEGAGAALPTATATPGQTHARKTGANVRPAGSLPIQNIGSERTKSWV